MFRGSILKWYFDTRLFYLEFFFVCFDCPFAIFFRLQLKQFVDYSSSVHSPLQTLLPPKGKKRRRKNVNYICAAPTLTHTYTWRHRLYNTICRYWQTSGFTGRYPRKKSRFTPSKNHHRTFLFFCFCFCCCRSRFGFWFSSFFLF